MLFLLISIFFDYLANKIEEDSPINENNEYKTVETSKMTKKQNILSMPNDINNKNDCSNSCQSHINIKNCIFNKSNDKTLYLSMRNKININENELIEIKNNYYDKCPATDFVNVIDSKFALIINNTFDFLNLENSCKAFHFLKCGNITIRDCHFKGMKTSGFIHYEPDTEATEKDFLLIEDCSFESCEGVCCFLDVKSNSCETITFLNCTFNTCQKGSDDSISILLGETTDSISLNIFESKFNNCGENLIDCYVIKFQSDQSKNKISLTIDNTQFSKCCSIIYINQNYGQLNFYNSSFTENLGNNGGTLSFESTQQVTISDCSFINNKAQNQGGSIHIFTSIQSSENIDTEYKIIIERCVFDLNEANGYGGALFIQTMLPFMIEYCLFTNNKANCGGSIYLELVEEGLIDEFCSITNCSFENNEAASQNGTVLFIYKSLSTQILIKRNNPIINKGEQGSIIYSDYCNFIVEDQLFDFSSTTHQKNFRAAHILNNSSAAFINCSFIRTGFTDNPTDGHAILIENSNIIICIKCFFLDCGHINSKYVIHSDSNRFQFISSTINFTDTLPSCSGIYITKISNLTFTNSTVMNCNSNNIKAGGGICYNYDRAENELMSYFDVSITGSTFDNIICKNGRAIFLKLNVKSDVQFCNCTIKNMPEGNYIVVISFESQITSPIISERIIFKDNQAICSDNGGGGGIGFWISQTGKHTFLECQFIRNINKKDSNGGVLGYTPGSTSNRNVELEFNRCYFEDNKVQSNYNGGALYISSLYRPVTIDSCIFSNTIIDSSTNGGAIYIDKKTNRDIIITKSNFTQIKVISKDKQSGNAIFIENTSAKVVIQECQFINCGTAGSVISTYGKNVLIEQTTIKFSDSSSCQGILVQTKCNFELISSAFFNCNSSNKGSAILYQPNDTDLEEVEFFDKVTLQNVLIDNCHSKENNGGSLFMTLTSNQTTFYNLTVQHINSQYGFIFVIEYNEFNPDFILFEKCNFIDCSREYNEGLGFFYTNEDKIIFNDCLFEQLTSQTNGGAVSYTSNNDLKITQITFSNCKFDQNKGINGSALYFNTIIPLNILDCKFTNNVNNNNEYEYGGGCIFIADNCQNVTIERTEFDSNTQNNAQSLGNAIYFDKQDVLVGYIIDCKFNDCGNKGSVIYSDGVSLQFTNNTFSFSEPKILSRSIQICKSCNIEILNTTFIKGGGILFDETDQIKSSSLTLSSCLFENNEIIEGSSIFIAGNFNKIIIQNCTFDGKSMSTNSCIHISCYHKTFIFVDNVFENFKEELNYISYINLNNQIDVFDISNIMFLNNIGKSGIIRFHTEGINELILNKCHFYNNIALKDTAKALVDSPGGYGGCFEIGDFFINKNISIKLENCIFKENKAEVHGGAISIETLIEITIINCTFEGNIANYQPKSMKNLLQENEQGKGGSIFIKNSYKIEPSHSLNETYSDQPLIEIEKCIFKNNEGYDGYAIYLAGEFGENIINIYRNDFINDFNDKSQNTKSLILSENCVISYDELVESNKFFLKDKSINVFSDNCRISTTPQSLKITSQSQKTKRVSFLISYSLTFVSQRSVSFSISYAFSNTYVMSYDLIEGTFIMLASQTNYQSYYPYIIFYLSPIYVERTVIIDFMPRKKISPEKLIGIACGSASAFFLILGIIILAFKKRNEIKNQYDEFDDISSSTEAEIQNNNKNGETVEHNTNEDVEYTHYISKDYSEVWI